MRLSFYHVITFSSQKITLSNILLYSHSFKHPFGFFLLLLLKHFYVYFIFLLHLTFF